jgi:hypothetical protein
LLYLSKKSILNYFYQNIDGRPKKDSRSRGGGVKIDSGLEQIHYRTANTHSKVKINSSF